MTWRVIRPSGVALRFDERTGTYHPLTREVRRAVASRSDRRPREVRRAFDSSPALVALQNREVAA